MQSRSRRAPIHVMSGFAQGPAAEATFLENLRYARMTCPEGITLLIEPLNRHDAPGYFLHSSQQASALLEKLGLPGVKMMFDCYHIGRTEGDLVTRIRELAPIIGHIQFAAVPDRGEPDRGEIDYAFVIDAIEKLGWALPLGAEYKPRETTDTGLGWLSDLRR